MTKRVNKENWKKMLASGTWEVSRRMVSIAGRVTGFETGHSISGVRVRVTSKSTKRRTRTRADGHFHFLDVPDGEYRLTTSPCSGSRHQTARVEAIAFHDVEGNIKELTKGNVSLSEPSDFTIKLEP